MEQALDPTRLQSYGFATTRWGIVTACQHSDPAIANRALGEICQVYWFPLYAVIRRTGFGPQEAEDLTQDFFLRMLKGKWIGYLDESKGRFRPYLLTALKHFLRDHRRRLWTLRRGRNCKLLSLDLAQAESMYALEPATTVTPELLYEMKWARTLVAQAIEQLRIEMSTSRRPELFDCFRSVIFAEADGVYYREWANHLGMSTGALETAVSRLRSRLRILLREEVARTLSLNLESEVEAEMQHLMRVMSADPASAIA